MEVGLMKMTEKETELSLGLGLGLGLPTSGGADVAMGKKRGFSETETTETVVDLKLNLNTNTTVKPPPKAQVVGWPPVRSCRKNVVAAVQKSSPTSGGSESELAGSGVGALVKVSMDGAPYLRKVDLKMYKSYEQLSEALGNMFSSKYYGSEEGMIDFMNERKLMDILNDSDYVPTYEDKDGDWMLVGDVPWEMFVESCKRIRIMKGKEAAGLAPRAMEKCKKNRS